jgi:hypothetical protein
LAQLVMAVSTIILVYLLSPEEDGGFARTQAANVLVPFLHG